MIQFDNLFTKLEERGFFCDAPQCIIRLIRAFWDTYKHITCDVKSLLKQKVWKDNVVLRCSDCVKGEVVNFEICIIKQRRSSRYNNYPFNIDIRVTNWDQLTFVHICTVLYFNSSLIKEFVPQQTELYSTRREKTLYSFEINKQMDQIDLYLNYDVTQVSLPWKRIPKFKHPKDQIYSRFLYNWVIKPKPDYSCEQIFHSSPVLTHINKIPTLCFQCRVDRHGDLEYLSWVRLKKFEDLHWMSYDISYKYEQKKNHIVIYIQALLTAASEEDSFILDKSHLINHDIQRFKHTDNYIYP